jgi:predicted dehydrogenase
MEDSANKNQKIIAVAENYRRDPINRLSKALLDEGILGIPYFALDLSIGSSHRSVMHSTVWRAKKDQAGGIVLDAGVHNADMLLYLMGEADTVYAETRILENERTLTDMGEVAPQLAKMYKHRREPGYNTGDKVKQDAVDTGFALVKFKSGAIGQLSITDASHGQKASISTITGSNGTLYRTESRSGNPIKLILFNGEEISGNKILDLVPNFKLDELTTKLWDGNSLIASYDLDFHETDARILAYEYMDWILSIQNGGKPEVGIPEGKNAIGLAYAIVESGLSESKIKVSDVISGKIDNYQKDIDISQNI